MSDRAKAFQAMKIGSIPGILDSSVYGIDIATMTEAELLICLGWSMSQCVRLMDEDKVGVKR